MQMMPEFSTKYLLARMSLAKADRASQNNMWHCKVLLLCSIRSIQILESSNKNANLCLSKWYLVKKTKNVPKLLFRIDLYILDHGRHFGRGHASHYKTTLIGILWSGPKLFRFKHFKTLSSWNTIIAYGWEVTNSIDCEKTALPCNLLLFFFSFFQQSEK